MKPIVFGNVARYFGKKREEDGHTHQWSVYVKPYRNEVRYLSYHKTPNTVQTFFFFFLVEGTIFRFNFIVAVISNCYSNVIPGYVRLCEEDPVQVT